MRARGWSGGGVSLPDLLVPGNCSTVNRMLERTTPSSGDFVLEKIFSATLEIHVQSAAPFSMNQLQGVLPNSHPGSDTVMPDLFFLPDDRYLRSRWDCKLALFRIVAREYRDVLRGVREQDHHRTILLQAVVDLIEADRDLLRRGVPSPVSEFDVPELLIWKCAVPLVRELLRWHIPGDWVQRPEFEDTLDLRKELEERFNTALLNATSGAPTEVTPPAPVVIEMFSL